jgi:hypothetical protein
MLDPQETIRENMLGALDGIADAAQDVVSAWETGDLAGAVTNLDQWITAAREVAADVRKTPDTERQSRELVLQPASERPYSDSKILDLIEDFLVNHFGDDEREGIEKGPAFDMLEHVSELADLRKVAIPVDLAIA